MAEEPGPDTAIARRPGTLTAFVGRTLRGPVDRPIVVRSYADFVQSFGGLWQPSPLSYAVEQYFENGGREAVVVRIVNGGRPATLSLPCGTATLTLVAQSPGSREALRASVDYDNISATEEDRFNLVVQRLRSAGSEHIEDQEIFRRVSCLPGSARFVASALQESSLVRVLGSVPLTRPDRTFRAGARHPIGYVDSNPDGDDGAPLTDYDIIGSAERGTGLFALRNVPDLHYVCIPPLARDRDVGAITLVVASRLCRDLRAILVVDPSAGWQTCDEAILGLRDLSLQNENAIMSFPRILAYDRLRARYEVFANCGAVAGVLVRMEQTRPWWRAEPDDELLLRPGSRPLRVLNELERQRLAAHGINPIQSLRAASAPTPALRTLARGAAVSSDGNLLTPRRRALLIMSSLETGTRWATFEPGERRTWSRIERQVRAFLQPMAAAQLFGPGPSEDAFYVVCDERLNTEHDVAEGRVNILVGLRSQRSGDYQSFLITHGSAGSTLRLVRSNWLPAGTRMTTHVERLDDVEITAPRRTLAAELYPRSTRGAVAALAPVVEPEAVHEAASPLAIPAPARSLERDDIARFYRDLSAPRQ